MKWHNDVDNQDTAASHIHTHHTHPTMYSAASDLVRQLHNAVGTGSTQNAWPDWAHDLVPGVHKQAALVSTRYPELLIQIQPVNVALVARLLPHSIQGNLCSC